MANVKPMGAAPVLYGQPPDQARRPGAMPVLRAGAPDQARAGTLSDGLAAPVPLPRNPTPPYTPPSPQTFGGTAPTPTPYGTFAGLDPLTFTHSPDYQYLLDSQQKALQRGAAAHGSLFTGGFQKALQANAAGLAAGDYGNQFTRELQAYDTNRATNAQNFGQQMDQYTGSLAGFNANTNAALGYGRLGLEAQQNAYDENRQGALDQRDYLQGLNDYDASQNAQRQGEAAQMQAAYEQRVQQQRAENAAALAGRMPSVQDQVAGQRLMAKAPVTPYGGGGRMPSRSLGRG